MLIVAASAVLTLMLLFGAGLPFTRWSSEMDERWRWGIAPALGFAAISAIAHLTGTRRDTGPDALVYAEYIYAIDTTCTHQATVVHNYAPGHARYRKQDKYRDFQSKTKWITTPVVMTSMASPDHETVQWLNLIGKNSFAPGLATRAIVAMSIAVVRGNHDIVSYLETDQLTRPFQATTTQ